MSHDTLVHMSKNVNYHLLPVWDTEKQKKFGQNKGILTI